MEIFHYNMATFYDNRDPVSRKQLVTVLKQFVTIIKWQRSRYKTGFTVLRQGVAPEPSPSSAPSPRGCVPHTANMAYHAQRALRLAECILQ